MKASTPNLFIVLSRLCLAELPDWLRQERYCEPYYGRRASDDTPVICMGARSIVCTDAGLFGAVRDVVERERVGEMA